MADAAPTPHLGIEQIPSVLWRHGWNFVSDPGAWSQKLPGPFGEAFRDAHGAQLIRPMSPEDVAVFKRQLDADAASDTDPTGGPNP